MSYFDADVSKARKNLRDKRGGLKWLKFKDRQTVKRCKLALKNYCYLYGYNKLAISIKSSVYEVFFFTVHIYYSEAQTPQRG